MSSTTPPTADSSTDTKPMSTTATECEYCEDAYEPYEGFNSQFCSRDCKDYSIAADAIGEVIHDHRYCANCYRQIREVEPPGRNSARPPPDFAIGYAYPTKHAVRGLTDIPARTVSTDADSWLHAFPTVTRESKICECGVTHHRMMLRPMTREDAVEAAKRLSDVVLDLREELMCGSDADAARADPWDHDKTFFVGLVDELQSTPEMQFRDQWIFERALGRAMRRAEPDSDSGSASSSAL